MKREPVLIANRGEIAIRIARTCRVLGFPSIALYSDADRFSDHVRVCDRAYGIGGVSPQESYLDVGKVLSVARRSGARFVHPGYGFLSERPHFVEACEKQGLIFVGPTAESMNRMGDKIRARETVDELKVPRVPGSRGAVRDVSEAQKVAKEIGYPVLLKASAGGGGKGMRRVDRPEEIPAAFEAATREATSAFGDGSLYVEKLILKPHHVEIQVFGDGQGGGVHLGERECSIQRRHQKVWEETPSPILERHPQTRPQMFEAALRIVSHLKYRGAGTLEFIVDEEGRFYFLEMNTRLQVEHPVTEWVTGVDLVAWQLLLASGEWINPGNPDSNGSSIEVRLYAEDPKTFLPSPGKLGYLRGPSGPFVRWDSAFSDSGEVTIHYDPMIAKLSVWGRDRDEALGRIRVALDEVRVGPPEGSDGLAQGSLRTNWSFLSRLARHPAVLGGDTATDLIPNHPELTADSDARLSDEAAVAVSIAQILSETREQSSCRDSTWRWTAIREGVRR